jgi:hypothetical protein
MEIQKIDVQEVTKQEAETIGAFSEDALSEQEVLDAQDVEPEYMTDK